MISKRAAISIKYAYNDKPGLAARGKRIAKPKLTAHNVLIRDQVREANLLLHAENQC